MPANPGSREVEWYGKHGKYRDRLRRCAAGRTYVIGDWSWHRAGRPDEWIEQMMRRAGVYSGGEIDADQPA